MKLQQLLSPDAIVCNATGTSKKRILDEICEKAAQQIHGLSQHELLMCLIEREKQVARASAMVLPYLMANCPVVTSQQLCC